MIDTNNDNETIKILRKCEIFYGKENLRINFIFDNGAVAFIKKSNWINASFSIHNPLYAKEGDAVQIKVKSFEIVDFYNCTLSNMISKGKSR